MTGGHGNWMGLEADGPDGLRHAVRTPDQGRRHGDQGDVDRRDDDAQPARRRAAADGRGDDARPAKRPTRRASRSRRTPRATRACATPSSPAVDSVEHGHGATVETLQLMLDRGTALVPTILSDRRIIEAPPGSGIPQFVIEKCVPLGDALIETLHNAFRMGVTIAAGNDGGAPLVEVGEMADELGALRQARPVARRRPSRAARSTRPPVPPGRRRLPRARLARRHPGRRRRPAGRHHARCERRRWSSRRAGSWRATGGWWPREDRRVGRHLGAGAGHAAGRREAVPPRRLSGRRDPGDVPRRRRVRFRAGQRARSAARSDGGRTWCAPGDARGRRRSTAGAARSTRRR